ncbi:MAG: iron ABC transporter permease [Candidatus Eremiobacteraeota bacterium]|nr:iron ABC transporter permease [Candidatus Eremiobacteraeota bacterium]
MTLRLTLLCAASALVILASVLVGGSALSPHDVGLALAHPNAGSDAATIVWQLRLPRILIAVFVGAGLAISGALLQGMLRNPLVDPFLTGVSAGAAAGIVASIVAGVGAAFVPAIGFVAGIATAALVATLARRGSSIDATRLILAGVSLSSLFSAFIALILVRAQSTDYSAQIVSWLAGSLAARGWNDLGFALPYGLAGAALAFISVPALNALRLGDVRAAALGLNVGRAQWTILSAASLLTASAVTLSGTIGFVGLIVPHIARRAVGSDARGVLPASIIIGAAIMALADDVARTLFAPAELPIGVLLAFVGVPAFLYLYFRDARVTT